MTGNIFLYNKNTLHIFTTTNSKSGLIKLKKKKKREKSNLNVSNNKNCIKANPIRNNFYTLINKITKNPLS